MAGRKGAPSVLSMIVQAIDVGGRHYECRLNRCGKRGCRVCDSAIAPPGKAPGHGPYWYLVAQSRGKTRRLYIGKELDTSKYVTPGGFIDWHGYRNRGKKVEEATNDPSA